MKENNLEDRSRDQRNNARNHRMVAEVKLQTSKEQERDRKEGKRLPGIKEKQA